MNVEVEEDGESNETDDNKSEEAVVEADSVEEVEGAREKRGVADDDSKEEEAVHEADDNDDSKQDEGADQADDDSAETATEPVEKSDVLESEEEKKQDEIDSKEDEAVNADEVENDDDSVEETSQVTKPLQTFPEDDLLIVSHKTAIKYTYYFYNYLHIFSHRNTSCQPTCATTATSPRFFDWTRNSTRKKRPSTKHPM